MSAVCKHAGMVMTTMRGPPPTEFVNWYECARFQCPQCNLDCFRQRVHGYIYNGPWFQWIPANETEKLVLTSKVVSASSYNPCSHPKLQKTVPLIPEKPHFYSVAMVERQEPMNQEQKISILTDKVKKQETTDWQLREVANFSCEDCGLRFVAQRELGLLFNGSWKPSSISRKKKQKRKKDEKKNKFGFFLSLLFLLFLKTKKIIMRFLVTGGSGFLGSHFIHMILEEEGKETNFVVNIDKLDYCSTKTMCESSQNYVFVQKDINEEGVVSRLILEYNIEVVVHFAAMSHVDSSFTCSRAHVINNVVGTHTVLEAIRHCHPINGVRLCQISSDEVYGQSMGDEAKTEDSLLKPSSPYSASKGCGELLCNSYVESFKLPIVIVRGNNAYGSCQYQEKVIPRFIRLLLENKPITIQGDGTQRRSFIHARDFAKAVLCVIQKGNYCGQTYNIGSNTELTIIELARMLATIMGRNLRIDFVEDRNFNDSRYLICAKKLKALGWDQTIDFRQGILETIEWYKSQHAKDYWVVPYELPQLKLISTII